MTKQEKLNKWIGQMSYYNAAEGSYSSEASARKAFKDAIAEEVKTWDITKDEFLELYNNCNRQLTTYSDFTYPLSLKKVFKESE